MNMAGIVVLGLGVFVLIVALRGTQGQILPSLFGPGSGNSGSGSSLPQCIVLPDSSGNCPTGYHKTSGLCVFDGSNCSGVVQ